MRKLILIMSLVFVLVSCKDTSKTKHSKMFFDTFDTQITYIEYTNTEEEFNKNLNFVKSEYERLHKLYDNYRNYEGINNIKTVNDFAGKKPVKVDKYLLDLVKYSIDNNEKTLGKVNIAMGSVLEIWHNIREENSGKDDTDTRLPNKADLEKANLHTDINDIEINEKDSSIYIKDPELKIDLGATAKGYATELISNKLEKMGVEHGSINAGGNVKTIGTPGDGRETWAIALQNPDENSNDYLDVLYIEGSNSVVTSGNYERYFMHNGERYDHLIDPETLWPNSRYNSVSIVTKDSGLADLISTALYLSTKEEADIILSNYSEDIGVVWADNEGKQNTENMDKIMKSKGAKPK